MSTEFQTPVTRIFVGKSRHGRQAVDALAEWPRGEGVRIIVFLSFDVFLRVALFRPCTLQTNAKVPQKQHAAVLGTKHLSSPDERENVDDMKLSHSRPQASAYWPTRVLAVFARSMNKLVHGDRCSLVPDQSGPT